MSMLNKKQYIETMRSIQRNTFVAADTDQMRSIMTEIQYALYADTIERQHYQAVEVLLEDSAKSA